ncbi:cytochrome P450 [Streptomyces aureocirculatus]|uniref:cytochrome P450 n=1 Tax=Streptomyces aureocirculatus TaxID=67275 RepID=UPI0004C654CB|nr:cytochrome P450 [Streptomyces aureocirculatus]
MVDSTLPLLTQGYAWLPDLSRRKGPGPVRTRLLGKPAVALRGPAAVEFFYDEQHVRRRTALPEPVLSTLFGHGAVHTLDGQEHRTRKALFVSLLKDAAGVAALAEQVAEEWDRSSKEWSGRSGVSLFDEVSVLITRAVCAWAGVPLDDGDAASQGAAASRGSADPDDPGPEDTEARRTARDLVTMVDGFATAGPRHFQARRSRRRQEKRLALLVEEIRSADGESSGTGRPATAVGAVAAHRDADGKLLDPRTAAVEILNIIRPTVAVTWYTVFGAHALHRNPALREPLALDRSGYARAFAHELRRFYPFAPFVAGLAPADVEWHGEPIEEGTLVLLDIYGQNHDPGLWHEPYTFDPERFTGREPGRDELVPQGGGEASEGHRCPGEDITLAVLSTLLPRLARLDYRVPEQDLRIPLNRMPTRPRSSFQITDISTK